MEEVLRFNRRVRRLENKLSHQKALASRQTLGNDDLDARRMREDASRALSLLAPGIKTVICFHTKMTKRYLSDTFRYYPGKFMETGKTPFIHPALSHYRLSSSAKAVFDACVSFSCRDQCQGVLDLKVSTTKLIMSQPATDSFEGLLHAVQAMTLAAMALLFTPGAASGKEAELLVRTIATWSKVLYNRVPSHLPSSLSHWEAWVYAESVRRTIMFSYIIVETFVSVTGGEFTHSVFLDALTFDGRTYLWEADDCPDDFDYSSQLNSYKEFTESYKSGRRQMPDCPRAFDVLLVTGCLGIERVWSTYVPEPFEVAENFRMSTME